MRGDILFATMHRRLLLLLLILLVPLRALAADWMAVGHGSEIGQEVRPHTSGRHAGAPCPGHVAGATHEAYQATHLMAADVETPARGDCAGCADDAQFGHSGCTNCDICHGVAITASPSPCRAPPRASIMNLPARLTFLDRKVPPGLKPPIA